MTAEGILPRHTLVWLAPEAIGEIDLHLAPSHQAQVRHWLAQGFPFVRRRPGPLPDAGHLPLGLPLPPSLGRERISLSTPPHLVRKVAPPLWLKEVIPAAPARWRPSLQRLNARLDELHVPLRVYGSLAWQCLTGMEYLTPASDIDLLFSAASPAQLRQVLSALTAWETESGLRADGELVLATGEAVAWRELLQTPAQVLVKSLAGVALMPWPEVLPRL